MARKKTPVDRNELFNRMAAAKAYVGSVRSPEHAKDVEMAAFMDIFHPRPEGYTINDVRKMRGR